MEKKTQTNIERDQLVNEQLRTAGWVVLRFWGNDIKKNLVNCVATIENTLKAR